MRLQDFIKDLFSQPAVDGFELGQVEIDICIHEDKEPVLVVGEENPCAKITIVPSSELKHT